MPLIRILFAGTLLFVAACAPGNVRLTHKEVDSAYDSGEQAYAGAGRDLLTVVYGNPFGGDQAAFAGAVTDAMQGRNWGQRINFTTSPGADARLTYKVVLLFDPPATLLGQHLCSESAETLASGPKPGEGIGVLAAFCRGDKALTEIMGYISSASGPEDAAFRELAGQVTLGLFPPDGQDDDCGTPGLCN